MLKYTGLPWSVHVQKAEAVKQSEQWSGLVDKYVQRRETMKQWGRETV